MRQNFVGGCVGHALEVRHGEKRARIAYVQQVMGHALHFIPGDLAAAQIQPPEHLPRIGGDDLAAVALRQAHGQPALAGCVGADDGDQRFVFLFWGFRLMVIVFS